MENRSNLFEEHNKEYGTQEAGYWRFEGRENLYRGLFNLVGNKSSCFYTNSQTEKYPPQVNHMEELTPSKEMDTVIKSAVLLRYSNQ